MATKRDVDVHHAAGKNVFGSSCIRDIPESATLCHVCCPVPSQSLQDYAT